MIPQPNQNYHGKTGHIKPKIHRIHRSSRYPVLVEFFKGGEGNDHKEAIPGRTVCTGVQKCDAGIGEKMKEIVEAEAGSFIICRHVCSNIGNGGYHKQTCEGGEEDDSVECSGDMHLGKQFQV